MEFVGGESRLEKEYFHMATKGEKGCKLVTDMEFRQKLLDLWESWLTKGASRGRKASAALRQASRSG